MIYLVIKVIISAILIVSVSEIAKHSTLFGSIIASLPLVSILAMIWLYLDTKNTEAIAMLSKDIFWLVIPSLVLFAVLPILLKHKMAFYSALISACSATIVAYFLMILLLRRFG